jgi:hypothetical protein
MSRERAHRREARLAAQQDRRLAAEKRAARRVRLGALWSWLPRFPRRGVAGTPARRRTTGERAAIVAAAGAVQAVTWYVSDSWTLRVAIAFLTVLAVPALTVLAFDRSNHR